MFYFYLQFLNVLSVAPQVHVGCKCLVSGKLSFGVIVPFCNHFFKPLNCNISLLILQINSLSVVWLKRVFLFSWFGHAVCFSFVVQKPFCLPPSHDNVAGFVASVLGVMSMKLSPRLLLQSFFSIFKDFKMFVSHVQVLNLI